MVDTKRIGPKTGEPLIERVCDVLKDSIRSANIAVVAGGNRKRYILASESMQIGDLIKTSGKLTDMPGNTCSVCIFLCILVVVWFDLSFCCK